MIIWKDTLAAVYRAKKDILKPIVHIDRVSFDEIIGYEEQKKAFRENTQRFLDDLPCNHVLLWGARGTGKSSLIKAMIHHYGSCGLRLLEFNKDDINALPDIADELRELPYKFVVFCDDISFDSHDNNYKALKSIIEGSIESPPKNIRIYATSNRRHLVQEFTSDNENVVIKQNELHYGDTVEEKISLSDRFGLWLSFYQGSLSDYLKIVDFYFANENCDTKKLHEEALRFATLRGSRSGRTAKQFYQTYVNKIL